MKKILFLFLFISSTTFGQDRTISLEKLAAKQEKSDANINISDHTIDGKRTAKDGYWLEFTGTTTRGLVFKNFIGKDPNDIKITFRDVTNRMGGSGVTIKLAEYMQNFVLDGTGTTKLYGLSGGSASQMIYCDGKFLLNPTIQNFYIDQGRPANMRTTPGGPALQIKGYNTSDCNASNWNIGTVTLRNIDGNNINDELVYINFNTTVGNYTRAKKVIIDNVNGYNLGRDAWQIIGVDSAFITNCKANNLGLEQEPNHVSGFSLNGGNKYVYVESVTVINAPQFVYSGTEGFAGSATFVNCSYTQGTHVGPRANQAMYLKQDKGVKYTYHISKTTLDAPNVKVAGITVDGARLDYYGNTFAFGGKPDFRYFNSGSAIEVNPPPVTVITNGNLEIHTTTTWDNVVTIRYFSIVDGVKIEFVKL